MEPNQYFISNTSFDAPQNGKTIASGDLKIWAHSNLELTESHSAQTQLTLLGFVFHPEYPGNTNFEILQNLAEHPTLSIEFFNYFNQLEGRFVLIVKENGQTVILNDPAAQRQVFYTFQNGIFYAASSPKLFYDLTGLEFQIPGEKQKIIQSKRFKLLEEWFPGDGYLDPMLKRLLPNFLIEIENGTVKRIPFTVQKLSSEALKKYIRNNIYGSLEACTLRFDKILFAVTAGSDSRLIFSLTPHDEKIEYFLYKRESENDVDYVIAKKLTQKKKINLTVVQPGKLSQSFLSFFKIQFLHPRILSKLRNIEWLKNHYENTNTVVIAGYAGEMLRNSTSSINPYHKKFENAEDFIEYLHYPKSGYLKNSIKKWWESLPEYLDNCQNLSPLDLFHWEQHMAPYCSQYTFEQDISGVEMFCPLSNRQMILNLIHNTTPEERSAPGGIIYQIINETSPEWKGIPYNPKPFLKKLKDEVFKVLPLDVVNILINR